MRTKAAARTAVDPWAVVTHAVRITCVADERGTGQRLWWLRQSKAPQTRQGRGLPRQRGHHGVGIRPRDEGR